MPEFKYGITPDRAKGYLLHQIRTKFKHTKFLEVANIEFFLMESILN
jgi:hypothetical protein